MHKVAEEHSLTIAQVGTLYAILSGETTMGRVAGALHCDASNVTGIVDRLVAQKLVVRHESERDRRTKTLRLTLEGKKITDAIIAKLPETIGCAKLSQTERATLHVAIGKLTA